MKQNILTLAIAILVSISTVFSQSDSKLVNKAGHISFFSHTTLEDITANNYKVVSTLDKSTGEVVFSVSMQSFEFEKAQMQKHFNNPNFLDTKQFPKAKFKGMISNLSGVDFSKDGIYDAEIKGELTIHGETNAVTENGTITIAGDIVTLNAKMNITLTDYKVAFEKGKPSTNIAKVIEATIKVEYKPGS
jgi:polyisoprenoid-binding protein YceI